jgi:hypothetical protein
MKAPSGLALEVSLGIFMVNSIGSFVGFFSSSSSLHVQLLAILYGLTLAWDLLKLLFVVLMQRMLLPTAVRIAIRMILLTLNDLNPE